MKRYDLQYRPDWAYNQASMMPSKEGRYVEFTDVQSLQAERDRLREALVSIRDHTDFNDHALQNIARKALEGGTP